MRVHCIQTLVKHIYILFIYITHTCIMFINVYRVFYFMLFFIVFSNFFFFLLFCIFLYIFSYPILLCFLQIRLYSIHLQYTYFMFIMNKLLLKLFCYCVQILFFINVTTTCYLFGIWFQFFVCVVFFKFCQGL